MKKLIALLVLAIHGISYADEKQTPGPLGGRLLALESGKAEFFVEADRTVTIAFYDDALNKIPAATRTATATAAAPSGKAKLDFQASGDVLKSTHPLPEGDDYVVVVQIRADKESKPTNFRITLLTHACGSCDRPEYACICDH